MQNVNTYIPSRFMRAWLIIRKTSAMIHINPYYNLAAGIAVFVSSIIDIRENITSMKKEHFLIVISVLMISESCFKLVEAYTKVKKGLHETHIPERLEKEVEIIEENLHLPGTHHKDIK